MEWVGVGMIGAGEGGRGLGMGLAGLCCALGDPTTKTDDDREGEH